MKAVELISLLQEAVKRNPGIDVVLEPEGSGMLNDLGVYEWGGGSLFILHPLASDVPDEDMEHDEQVLAFHDFVYEREDC